MSRTDGLTDPKPKWDPTADTWAYNNFTDRIKVELPPFGHPSASGVVSVKPLSGMSITKNGNWSAAQTNTEIWDPGTGKKVVLLGVMVSTDAANNVTIKDGTGNDLIPTMYFANKGGAVISGEGAIWNGPAGEKVTVTSTVATNFSVLLWGYED